MACKPQEHAGRNQNRFPIFRKDHGDLGIAEPARHGVVAEAQIGAGLFTVEIFEVQRLRIVEKIRKSASDGEAQVFPFFFFQYAQGCQRLPQAVGPGKEHRDWVQDEFGDLLAGYVFKKAFDIFFDPHSCSDNPSSFKFSSDIFHL